MRHLVVDVQVVMIGAGLSSPPDDGTSRRLLDSMQQQDCARLVWDDGGLIRSQYERKLRPQTFGRDWYEELLVRGKVVSVSRRRLSKRESQLIRGTGLVGEDLNYYVRTAASSPDRRLVSHDRHYDSKTCACVKREISVHVISAQEAVDFVRAA
jgi:hypothetical protein